MSFIYKECKKIWVCEVPSSFRCSVCVCHSVVCSLAHLVTQVKARSRETHSLSRTSKIYGHKAFQLIHINAILSTVAAQHYSTPHTMWGCAVELASALTVATIPGWCRSHPRRLRIDLKCVEWDVKPYHTVHTRLIEGQNKNLWDSRLTKHNGKWSLT